MSEFTRVLQVNESWTVPGRGTNLYVLDASGEIEATVADVTDTLRSGDGLEASEIFTQVVIVNTHSAAQSVTVKIASRNFRSGRIRGDVDTTEAATSALAPDSVTVGGTAVTIAPVTGQRRITIRCAAANTGTVTIGTTSGDGLTFAKKEGISLDTAAAVVLIASASGQVVEILQES